MKNIDRGVHGVLVALVLGSTLVGCGGAQQRRNVGSRFQALHSCEAERVQPSERGYVVTGCGITAHYACVTYDPFPDWPGERMRCMETNVSSASPQAPSRQARVLRETDEDGSLRLTATSSFAGGSVTFEALPERFPAKAVVRLFVLRADAEDDSIECTGDLWIDGERVAPHEEVIGPVSGGALYSLLVDLTVLDRMDTAERVAARVCGVDVVVAQPAGRLARELAIRAREESSASQP